MWLSKKSLDFSREEKNIKKEKNDKNKNGRWRVRIVPWAWGIRIMIQNFKLRYTSNKIPKMICINKQI